MTSEKAKRPMRPDDILRIRWVTDPQLSPDGTRVAYVVTTMDEKANEYRSHVYVVETGNRANEQTGKNDMSQARQLTNGPKRDTSPRWSPDGRHLAFLSERGEEKRQVWVIPADGGEAWQLTKAKGGANSPAWAPDGSRIAFTARVEAREADKGPDGKPLPKVRRITTLKYKSNGEGFVDDKRSHVFAVDLDFEKREPSEGRQLTRGDFNHGAPVWSPAGGRIAFTSARHRSRDRDGAGDVWVMEVGGDPGGGAGSLKASGEGGLKASATASVPAAGLMRLTGSKGPVSLPAWSPDGSMIAYLGHEDRHAGGAKNHRVWVVGVPPATGARVTPRRLDSSASPQNDNDKGPQNHDRGGPQSHDSDGPQNHDRVGPQNHDRVGPQNHESEGSRIGDVGPRCLTPELDRTCSTGVEPAWSHDGKSVLFGVMDSGDCHVYSVDAFADGLKAGKLRLRQIVNGERQVTSASFSCGSAAFLASDATHPAEVFWAGEDGRGERRLTFENDRWLDEVELVKPSALAVTSADGTAVGAWLVRPATAVHPDAAEAGKTRLRGRDRKTSSRRLAPCLLNVHGGPHGQYGNVFFDEFQVYAGAGYAVVYGNPRGSQGYGEGFANAIRGAWGGKDWEDVTAIADAIGALDFIDQERVGIMGGSYGGYMTSWAVGHTERFKAACSERAVNNAYSMVGSSDIGFSFQTYEMGGATPFKDPDRFLRMSPVHYLNRIRTPLLIIHSENDLRCPIEQAEQLYVGLKLLRRPVEFWRFPEENHEMSRAGKPKHRLRRFEVILGWFGRKL